MTENEMNKRLRHAWIQKDEKNTGNGRSHQPRKFTFCFLHKLQHLEAAREGSSMLIMTPALLNSSQ